MAWWTELFRKKDDYNIVSNSIPLSTVARWYLYDTSLIEEEHINDFAELIGLTRVSTEGHEMELMESLKRTDDIHTMLPFLDFISDVSSQLFMAIHLNEALESGASDEEIEEQSKSMKNIYKAIALSTLVGAFSSALNIGMIDHNTVKSTVSDIGEENE
jgi:hypothetical protein